MKLKVLRKPKCKEKFKKEKAYINMNWKLNKQVVNTPAS